MTMKKNNGGSDRRPYDIRRVSRMQPNKTLSQDALARLSLYEEVNRQFAQEFPQTAWNSGQQFSLPWLLSPRSKQQEDNTTTASADNATSTGTMPAHDFEFITPTDYSHSAHNDDGDFDVLSATTSPTTTTAPMAELSDMPDPFATLSTDFDPLWDLDNTLDSLLPWGNNNNQAQGPYHCAQAMRNKGRCEANDQEQLEGSGLMVLPPLFEHPAEHSMMMLQDHHAIAEDSCVDRKNMKKLNNMNQIIFNLDQLGSRLRDDARRQLDVISHGRDASPLSFGGG
ncbi:hypothetical protein ACQKWADRAFT_291001 [Trichoderma austrokoningii]